VTLIGSFYVSIGVFTSALTRNQIVAAVLCFACLFFTFGVSLLHFMQSMNDTAQAVISYISSPEHLSNAGLGIFDSRPLVYYVTASLLMLYLAKSVVQGRRLKG
jgi:ABC-2 type transport system permease protein